MLDRNILIRSSQCYRLPWQRLYPCDGWCSGHEWPHKQCPKQGLLVFIYDTLWYVHYFLAATKQLYDWFSPSVRPSVRLSVRPSVTPFSPCSHHRIIIKFSGLITKVRSDVHAKGQGQRSKVKITEVNTQLSRFRTLTPVWIHIWQWNHAHSWRQHRRGAQLFFRVIRQISR